MKKILTDELISTLKPIEFLSFPKPKKIDRGFMRHGIPVRNKTKLARKRHQTPKFKASKTFPQLVKELDTLISAYILKKGNYTCVRCGKKYIKGQRNLTCSHYWDRQYKGTRWDSDNLDPLCWMPCHSQKWEHDKNGAYKDYMIKKLGTKKLDKLEIKARAIAKFSSVDLRLFIGHFDKIWK